MSKTAYSKIFESAHGRFSIYHYFSASVALANFAGWIWWISAASTPGLVKAKKSETSVGISSL